MKYNPAIHHRRSIRLRGYDYSREGAYFVTLCTHNRRRIFGHIENGEMMLNEYGQLAYQEWEKLSERWPHIELGAFQIMPNHIHGIIIIHDAPVGAPLAGAPDTPNPPDAPVFDTPDPPVAPVFGAPARGAPTTPDPIAGAHSAADMRDTQIQWANKPTLGQIVGAYRSCVLTGCLKIAQSKQPEIILGKLWQRNYWEHIIRNLHAFDRISNYIILNPENWQEDKFYNKE